MDNRSWKDVCRHQCHQIFSLATLQKKLPITKWLPKYRLDHLQGDAIAGLTVGLTVIPQGLALAHVAQLPPQYGLYTSFLGCFVYVFLGSSKDITVGPTAIMSLLVSQFGQSPIPGDATYAIILALFSGLIQLGMGILHIGFLIDYISHPVINSFTTAAAITIGEGQLKNLFGLHNIPRDFMHELYWTLRKLPETNLWDFVLGAFCIILLVFLKLLKDMTIGGVAAAGNRCVRVLNYFLWMLSTGRNALVVLLAAATVVICQSSGIGRFTTAGNVTAGLPPFRVPAMEVTYDNHTFTSSEIFSHIGFGFAIIPIVGLVETMAIGKAFAKRNGYKLDPNQEFVAVGAANILGSFVSAYPVTGSFSRTAVNSASGVRTPAGGIFTGALVILALIFLAPFFHLIPNATLAAVIIMAVSDMVDFSLLKKLWRVKRIDLIPWIVTFIFCLVLGVEWGILIGIGLSLLMLLYPSGRPVITDITEEYLLIGDMNHFQDVLVFTLSQGLVFPAVEYLKETIASQAITDDLTKCVVLDCTHVANIDYTTVEGVGHLLEEFNAKGATVVFCCLQPNILRVLDKAKLSNFHHSPTVIDGIHLVCSVQSHRRRTPSAENNSGQNCLDDEPLLSLEPQLP